ncbi:chromate efflux transporter [Vannielia litorea]|uniref:chromate efflux transporter n=1 Tax=Vannielia litorea TaxID=1217970 RepID=UPI001C961E80|nr:chromate efflux transporter [Vannielia litorea]MBY6047019.1 chromate efflux transporter [Vannielia litorea]MBY6074433.1 chromate efflux transporter [Vannielia litorea]
MTVPLSTLTRTFARIGVLSFGGPAAQIALMHEELVERRAWLTEKQYLSALSFCMMLPGPEAMQLCTYAGWRLRGVLGGLIAGTLFVLPGALVVLALALAYATWGQVPLVQSLFLGIQAAVVVIVVQALIKVAKRAFGPGYMAEGAALAALAFLAIYALRLPFPLIIAGAALWGAFRSTTRADTPAPLLPPGTARRTALTVVIFLTFWAAPFALLTHSDLLTQLGLFFSKLAVVTFGGAYAVLAYMTQEVVGTHGWLTTPEMIDALGLAETTPGPLILVTEFVATLAGAKVSTANALAAAALTLWVTFIPCFLWIFAGAPYLEWLTHQPRLSGALRAITAAVVGVIANLSLWFALHVLFAEVHTTGPALPVLSTAQPLAFALTALAALLLLALRLGMATTLALMALAGLATSLLG